MEVWFLKTQDYNAVVITDDITAKVYSCAPIGFFDGKVDIYADDAVDGLREYFIGLEEKGELQRYEDIYCPEEDVISYWELEQLMNEEYVEIYIVLRRNEDMTVNEYQQNALRTENADGKEEKSSTERLINGLMGLCGESGEAIDILKKHLYQGHILDKREMALELGDVAWYLAVSADALGYTLEEIMRMNVDKLRERYPDGFEYARSIFRRDDLEVQDGTYIID